MRVTTADFRSFIEELKEPDFMQNMTCTFTMLNIVNSIDIVISGISVADIQIAEDADLILLMTNGNTVKMVYDGLDMNDVTDEQTYMTGGQTWQWRFITGDNSYAALTFEIAA